MDDLTAISRKSKLFQILKPPNPCLNYQERYIKKLVFEASAKSQKVIDIGSGGRRLSNGCINLDIAAFNNVNIVCSGFMLPIKTSSADLIIITAVLEHVAYPDRVVQEIFRILKPGGKVYVEIPFLQPFHADPSDFQRYTIEGLKNLFRNFETLESGVCVGPFSAVAFFLRKFSTIFFGNVYLAKMSEYVMAWLVFWIKYFDWLLVKAKRLHVVAAGVYLLLSKSSDFT